MGVVYLAREVRLAREVAIKVLPPELAARSERRAQFLRERKRPPGCRIRTSRRSIASMKCRVSCTSSWRTSPVKRSPSESRQRAPLTPHHASRVLREVAWALTYAHANGIVHRDVKADNIMIERATERAVVTDFGIASLAHTDARTSDGQVAGSPHYASPEQIAGEPVDAASDLYSLGVVGFFALTGRLPFDAPTAREVCAMHLGMRPPSIASLAPTVPAKLAQLVERCLAKRPNGRPASAAAFAEAVEQSIEPPREIPAPIRVWLTKTNQTGVGRPLVAAYLVLAVSGIALRSGAVALSLAAGGLLAAGFWLVPSLLRAQRVLSAGYGVEDLRVAIRDYWIKRREEEAYELSPRGGGITTPKALAIFGVSAITTAALQAFSFISPTGWLMPLAGLAGTISAATGVLMLGRVIRKKLNPQLGSWQIKFYGGKWVNAG
jgi:serine/threonine-protein kinase